MSKEIFMFNKNGLFFGIFTHYAMLLLEEMTMMVVPSNSIPDGVLVGRRHNFYYKNSTLTMMTNLERKKKVVCILLGQNKIPKSICV